jgi:hypothetical protein
MSCPRASSPRRTVLIFGRLLRFLPGFGMPSCPTAIDRTRYVTVAVGTFSRAARVPSYSSLARGIADGRGTWVKPRATTELGG